MKTRLLLGLLIAPLTFAPSLRALLIPPTSLSIPSIAPWTDTGIDVAAGEIIEISATGTVTVSTGGPPNDANGLNCCSPNDPLPLTIHLSLIGKIVSGGEPIGGTPV